MKEKTLTTWLESNDSFPSSQVPSLLRTLLSRLALAASLSLSELGPFAPKVQEGMGKERERRKKRGGKKREVRMENNLDP